jgi:hypothetical protein
MPIHHYHAGSKKTCKVSKQKTYTFLILRNTKQKEWSHSITSGIWTHYEQPLQKLWGNAVAQLVEALRYKPEGHWNFSLT